LIGDGTAAVTQWFGEQARKMQTGKVQQYMLIAILLASFGFFMFLIGLQP
jgi:hypothetical protein